MNRRHLLTAGVAVVAAGAGAGLAWHQRRVDAPVPASAEPSVWSLHFDGPDGTPVSVASFRGKRLLLNFWATWCAPCVKEMPMLDRFHRAQVARGWQVLALAVDGPTPVREFLTSHPVGFPIGLAGMEGVELSRSLGNTQGGLPFTVVFDREGRVRDRKLGALTDADLSRWAA